MDIMLPEKNGYEITADIREYERATGRSKLIPIIALTANTLDNDKEKCLTAGMDDYLSKPFTAEELQDMISKYINNPV
jgi:osomolarity two-component system sensor histidine kinase NIK1